MRIILKNNSSQSKYYRIFYLNIEMIFLFDCSPKVTRIFLVYEAVPLPTC